MKHLIVFLLLATCSASAFAQFPLGGKEKDIKAYFNKHIPYASAKDFKTEDRISGVRFLKARGIGDYTFYFDSDGNCSSYVVTYSNNELDNVVNRLNAAFKPVNSETWVSDKEDTSVTVLPSQDKNNCFSVVYSRSAGNGQDSSTISLASN
jgi:hypothetical protein